MKTKVDIYLGSQEYGNVKMNLVANEFAIAHKADWPLLITVHEHGGWFLQYYNTFEFNGIIVGTANDGAHFTESQERIRKELQREQEWNELKEVRRV